MSRPSDPLLKLLRDLVARRGLNSASVAAAASLDRVRVRKVLTGAEPMTVDELLAIGQALEVAPEELGLGHVALPEAEDDPRPAIGLAEPSDELSLDPWGNQVEQIFRVAFTLGCDFMFVAQASELEDSGVPAQVLERYDGRDLPIRLDASYHKYNAPRYDAGGITLTLSFDALYDCRFPWSSVRQVILFPTRFEPPEEEKEERPAAPVLRLVT